jgi:hypothetical protein
MTLQEHKDAIAALVARLAELQKALAYRAPRNPPEGVPFEDFAREILQNATTF